MSSIVEQISALEPGMIRVYRDAESDVGYREVILYLDGRESRSVKFKEIVEIPVRPGTHTLRATNRVFKSAEYTFEVQPGQCVSFQAANTGKGLYVLFMLLCMGIPKIELRMETPELLDGRLPQARRMTR